MMQSNVSEKGRYPATFHDIQYKYTSYISKTFILIVYETTIKTNRTETSPNISNSKKV